MNSTKDATKKSASAFRLKAEPVGEEQHPPGESKFQILESRPPKADEEYLIPRASGSESVFLIAQDPHRLFTYWDLDILKFPGGPAFLRCLKADDESIEAEIEIPFEARNWYLPVGSPATEYVVEIGYYRDGAWNPIGRSEPASTPPDSLADDASFHFATLPISATFTSLLASIEPGLRHHPELSRKVADLQSMGRLLASGALAVPTSDKEALEMLSRLLGEDLLLQLLSSPGGSSELSSKVFSRLQELLSSESASALLTSFPALAAESSLFSGITHFESLSSETLGSWTQSLVSWASAIRGISSMEWLSSWSSQSGGISSEQSSWMGPFLSSWGAALREVESSGLSSAFSGVLSSGAVSSWQTAQLSSWLSSAYSGWSAKESASWLAALSSAWSSESLASWTNSLLEGWTSSESGSWSGASLHSPS